MTHTPEARLDRAQGHMAEARIYEAIGELETLIGEHPAFLPGYIHLGLLHFQIGAIAKGREFMNQALSRASTLEEKGKISAVLREQDRLDRNRYYRPDFEALQTPPRKTA